MRVWLLLFALLCGLPAAAARSLAVLPLDQGAKSATHEGLGRALAGMLISDLSRVESLELVERSRLDVLLKEIELGESGFLDPKTAAKLGNGVGADWVIIGSWSVVGQTFLMDSRAVDVASGKIVAAVDANGQIDDFITVEKTLVEDLLAALEVVVSAGARRKIIADAATEDFEAMTSYAAGLQAEFDGRYDDAKQRFEAAAKRDPAFDLPLQRLADVRGKLERLEAERVQNRVDDRTQKRLDALAKSPDEMQIKGRSTDPAVLAKLRVRWAMLEQLDRHCQLVEELTHYVERHKGKLPHFEHPIPYNHGHWAAFDLGLYEKRPEIWQHGTVSAPRAGWGIDRAPSPFYLPNLVVNITDGIDRAAELGGSLANESIACAGTEPAARVAALEAVMALIRKYKVEDTTTSTNGKRPIWTEVEILLLQAMAERDGMTAEVQQRVNLLMDLETGSEDDDYAIRADVQMVARTAQRVALLRAVSEGLTEAEIERVAAGAFTEDDSVVDVKSMACKVLAPQLAFAWKRIVEERAKARPSRVRAFQRVSLASGTNGLRLAGCIRGTPAVLPTLPEALAWVDTMPSRLRSGRPESCDETMKGLAEQTKSYRTAQSTVEEHYRGAVIAAGMRVVSEGCATLR